MRCTLCDLPVEDAPVTDSDVDGAFCCRGCLEVHRSVGDVDVDGGGATADAAPDRPDEVPDGAETAYLAVDGMHCSTCEAFLESVAREREGVHDADASYAAGTVRVVYDPDAVAGTELPDAVSGLGYTARRRDDPGEDAGTDLESRLLVGGIFGMMAMVWYSLFLYPTYFGYEPVVELGRFDGAYLSAQLAVVTAVVFLYTGRPILRGAYVSLRTGRPNVDLLVTTAALAAFLYSTGRLLAGGTDLYYDVTLVVVLAVTVGNSYEQRIKGETAGLLADLTELRVEEATLAEGGTVPVSEVDPGDRLLVAPGERVPVDGTVQEGTAAVDEALVTGESLPETKRPGDGVRGGTVVTDAPLVVAAGPDAASTLDRIVELLWDIQASRPGAQRVADRLATVFVPLVLAAALAATGWLLATGTAPRAAVLTGLTVLIVSCPCALGLATPLAVASGLQAAADRGIVVATPSFFERADAADVVVFDKTGTLTAEGMTVTDIAGATARPEVVLRRAGALEGLSQHPAAAAIASAAADASGSVPDVPVEEFEQYARGVAGTVEGESVLVGHPELFGDRDWTLPRGVAASVERARERGDLPVVVGWNGRARGTLSVGERPRAGWESVLGTVGADARVVVLTGDDGPAVDRYRDHPAIDDVFAGVPPDGKAETVRRLAATGTVAMVGDGSNDAPALAAADVGIALGSGTELATDAADAVVVGGGLGSVPAAFDVAARTKRRVRENLAWAFVYNGAAIPLALAGALNPLFAAVAMATSSLLVVANSARTPGDAEAVDDGREKRPPALPEPAEPPPDTLA